MIRASTLFRFRLRQPGFSGFFDVLRSDDLENPFRDLSSYEILEWVRDHGPFPGAEVELIEERELHGRVPFSFGVKFGGMA